MANLFLLFLDSYQTFTFATVLFLKNEDNFLNHYHLCPPWVVRAVRTRKVIGGIYLDCVFLQLFLKIIQSGIEYMTGTRIVSFK